jgi:hypothetical protein
MPERPRSPPQSGDCIGFPTLPMPRTLDLDKYPDEFVLLLERGQLAPVHIPHDAPEGLRGYIQAFLRAVERSGAPDQQGLAKQLQVTCDKQAGIVIVQRRSEGRYAKAVAAALGTTMREQADAAAKRLMAKVKEFPL